MTSHSLLHQRPPQPLLTNLAHRAARRSGAPALYSQLHHSASHQQAKAHFEFMLKNELPEYQARILATQSLDKIAATLYEVIETNFFPLDESAFDPYESAEPPQAWYQQILEGIPWWAVGRSWEELHDLWDADPPGLIHAALLITGQTDDYFDDGIRTTWFQSAADTIEPDLAEILWNGTWTIHETIGILDTTEHVDVAHALRYITNWEANPFLDSLESVIEQNLHTDPWTRPVIEGLANDWNDAKATLDHLRTASEKLDTDPNGTLRRIAEILSQHATTPKNPGR